MAHDHTFECPVCRTPLESKDALARHVRERHSDQLMRLEQQQQDVGERGDQQMGMSDGEMRSDPGRA
jgi:hypothetical protein